ncbi:MAG TPA: mechanosensitive ion channel domain-containing protein [Stellaceae bacterium]|nr:mechanosensitive ion channel domain-containing protein [Stellaceae bacterium]
MFEQKTQLLMTDMGALLPLIVSNALNALGAIVILLVGFWLSGRADRLVVRTFSRTPHFDPMLRSFFGSLARYLVLTITVLAVLSEFGIQTTSLVAVLGAAGLAVGLALQGTLSNLAAGVMLLIFRPFRIGHKVQVGGSIGTVQELTLFWTELVTDDKVQVIVPNGGVWGQPLRNYSIYPAPPHAGEARFRIADDLDPDWAIEKIRALVEADSRVLTDPAPSVLLDCAAADHALEIVVGFSTAGNEVAVVKSDLIKAVQAALAAGPGGQPATGPNGASAPDPGPGIRASRQGSLA